MKNLLAGIFACLIFLSIYKGGYTQTPTLDSLHFVFEKTRDEAVRVNTLIKISNQYERSDLIKSLEYAQQAMDIAVASKNEQLISIAAMHLGYVQFYLGLLEIAAKNFSLYQELAEKAGDPLAVANASTNLAGIHIKMNNLDEGKKELLKAKEIYEKHFPQGNDTLPIKQLIPIYNNLGIIAQNQKSYEQALEYYNRGIVLASKASDQKYTLGNLFNNLGSTYLEIKNFEQAYDAFRKALVLREELIDKQGIASSYRSMANYYKNINDLKKAGEYLYKGYGIAQEVGDFTIISSYSNNLYEYYKTLQKPDSALKYLELARKLEESISTEEAQKELVRIGLTTQFREKERLQREAQIRRDLWLLVLGIVLLFSLITALLLLRMTRGRINRLKLQAENAELYTRNLELKQDALEKELEVKNKELTTNVMYQIRKNELLNDIAQNLMEHVKDFRKENQNLIQKIVKDLEESRQDNSWEEFEMRFHQVHNDFYEKLNTAHADLTLNERRLCAFLKLNMSTKEIASITGQSPRSIDVARTRLRKKLNLTNSESSLTDYLVNL